MFRQYYSYTLRKCLDSVPAHKRDAYLIYERLVDSPGSLFYITESLNPNYYYSTILFVGPQTILTQLIKRSVSTKIISHVIDLMKERKILQIEGKFTDMTSHPQLSHQVFSEEYDALTTFTAETCFREAFDAIKDSQHGLRCIDVFIDKQILDSSMVKSLGKSQKYDVLEYVFRDHLYDIPHTLVTTLYEMRNDAVDLVTGLVCDELYENFVTVYDLVFANSKIYEPKIVSIICSYLFAH